MVSEAIDRLDAIDKVTGRARYAVEHRADGVVHAVIVQSTVASGRIASIESTAARALDGVIDVLHVGRAPQLQEVEDRELHVFQSDEVTYRGEPVAVVIAESRLVAQHAAGLVEVAYEESAHQSVLRVDDPGLYAPERVNAGYATDTTAGDFDRAYASAAVCVDAEYRTPAEHNNPIETHATLASWDRDALTLYDSSQGTTAVAQMLGRQFGVDAASISVRAPHVGGGFGAKGMPRPNTTIAAMAARWTGRPVSLAVTRQQMFAFTGYRTPTIQRVRLGADAGGRLVAIRHDAVSQSSRRNEFAEQTAVATRTMYTAPNMVTTHRLARLNVPSPSWMRAPGECPGMYALECAVDELATATGVDPVELRIRNEPERDPETGKAYSSRNLVACLREGARRFGWDGRDPEPGARRDGRWQLGTGVASSMYPARLRPASATAERLPDGRWLVRINATDIGTGARTVLAQLAVETLHVPVPSVVLEIGDSQLPAAGVAGGSTGTSSWGTAVVRACEASLANEGARSFVDTTDEASHRTDLAYYGFGAQFVEARVNVDSGEVRIPRMLGVFAVGRIVNPKTARSQLVGGMTWGLSMALMEESAIDHRTGMYVNHDLARYHVATNADVGDVEAVWIDEHDPYVNPMGVKGIGEIGIVGAAAAVANAVWHATATRVRDLPIRPDKLIG